MLMSTSVGLFGFDHSFSDLKLEAKFDFIIYLTN